MKILVWLSGWVDSAVSALLLQRAGHTVAGGFMVNYLDETESGEVTASCPTREDLAEAKRLAEFLDIPFYTFDYREEYESRIIEYIYREYARGNTPNPDVFCNNLIKFDLFLEEALSLGYDAIATGHYVRNGQWTLDVWHLFKWVDPEKDQSYFLSRLTHDQITHAVFPLGGLLKSEVRQIALEAGLPNATRKDSQGLCFIGKVSMREFLERRIEKQPWMILDSSGRQIGMHEGAFSYTIGQRKGIGVWWGPARFVIAKDIWANTITVGTEDELDLYSSRLIAGDWIATEQIQERGQTLKAKIRYRQPDQSIDQIRDLGNGAMEIVFSTPQRAVNPGQIVVLYEGDRVVGSGVIR